MISPLLPGAKDGSQSYQQLGENGLGNSLSLRLQRGSPIYIVTTWRGGLNLGLLFSPFLLYGQSLPAILFTNVTVEAGIKFVHYKGANGSSSNREELGPGLKRSCAL